MPPRHRQISIFAPVLVAGFLIAIGSFSAGAEALFVTVRDIRSSEGKIRIALYDSADDILVDGQSAATRPSSCSAGPRKPSGP